MTFEVYDDLDFHHNQVKGLVPQQTAGVGPPAGVIEGELWYDTTNHNLMYRDTGGTSRVVMYLRTLDLIPSPVASVAFNAQKITGLAPGTAGTDGVNFDQLNNAVQGLDNKVSCKYGFTTLTVAVVPSGDPTTGAWTFNSANAASYFGNGTIANYPVDTRLLLSSGTGADEKYNGIYVVVTNNGTVFTLSRALDFDSWAEVPSAYTWVEAGTAQDTGWVCISDQGGTFGTTAITWTQFTGAGLITAGLGLSKAGNVIDVNVDGASIEISTDILRVKAGGITNAMLAGAIDLATKVIGVLPTANGGTSANTVAGARQNLLAISILTGTMALTANTWTTITHGLTGVGLSTGHVVAAFYDENSGSFPKVEIHVSVRLKSATEIEIKSAIAWAANQLRYVITG